MICSFLSGNPLRLSIDQPRCTFVTPSSAVYLSPTEIRSSPYVATWTRSSQIQGSSPSSPVEGCLKKWSLALPRQAISREGYAQVPFFSFPGCVNGHWYKHRGVFLGDVLSIPTQRLCCFLTRPPARMETPFFLDFFGGLYFPLPRRPFQCLSLSVVFLESPAIRLHPNPSHIGISLPQEARPLTPFLL